MSVVPPDAALVLVIGDSAGAARRTGLHLMDELGAGRTAVVDAPPAEEWPFRHPLMPEVPEGPVLIWAPDVDRAFENHQTAGTRLVTTQAHYLFAEWESALTARGDAMLVCTSGRAALERHAEEIGRRRGVFRRAHIVEAPATGRAGADDGEGPPMANPFAAAFRLGESDERLRRLVATLAEGRTAPALVATASACQEVNDLEAAGRDLDEAMALAPDWAAPRFERGKVWLRLDRMEEAAAAFREAAERLPGFGGAWGNLGATLGELDRPDAALQAFERLRHLDPDSPQAVNNVGVVTRELGRLAESEAAFRRVTELEPELAFGYYNLGHTLFLQGRYHAAAAAYAQGQSRDPQKNPVQATRLALCRLASGDAEGALAEMRRATTALPREYRRQVLADTSAVLWALVTHKPDLAGWHAVHDWLNGELARLA